MQKLVFTNGGGQSIDLTSGNFGITNWEGLSGVGLNIQTQQVPFQDGGVFLDALIEQREISVTVAIQDNNDLSARYERKRQLISALNPKLGEGVLVYTNDYLSRQIKAVPQLPIFENKNSNDAGTLKANVTFSCCSPYWEDLGDTVVVLRAGEISTIENEGDIPAQLEIKITTGKADSPAIKNISTQKKIEYNGELSRELYINTNIGNKKVELQELGIEGIVFNQEYTDICYAKALNMFVAIGEGALAYSYNGIDWTEETFENFLEGRIYFINGKFFICSTNKSLYVSEDLHNWRTISITLRALVYVESKNKYYAISSSKIYESSDGENWTLLGNRGGADICYSEKLSLFVVTDGNYNYVYTSSDGVTWTQITITMSGSRATNRIIYSEEKELFVLGGNSYVYTSADGTNWTEHSIAESSPYTSQGIIYINDLQLFIIVSGKGTIYTSSDGTSWPLRTSGVTTILKGITYNEDTGEIIICGSGGTLLSSHNAINWTNMHEGVDTTNYNSICYSSVLKKLCIVGAGGKIKTSTNETDWAEQTSGVSQDLNSVVYGKDKFVVVGKNGRILTSEDGQVWTPITMGSKELRCVAYSKKLDLYVAVGVDGTLITSADGTSWTARQSNTRTLNSVIYSEEKEIFVAVGFDVIISSDGENWTRTYFYSSSGYEYQYVQYLKNIKMFIASHINTNQGLRTAYSSDGVNWTFAETDKIGVICYSDYFKCLFGRSSDPQGIIKSATGEDLEYLIQFSIEIKGICFSEISNQMIFVGNNGNILKTAYNKPFINAISDITNDSDINLNLKIGENQLALTRNTGDVYATISFRQKYIGV